MTLLLAGDCGDNSPDLGNLHSQNLLLRPSYPDKQTPRSIPLQVIEGPVEIRDWDTLSRFAGVDDTRKLINKVLHYQVLGPKTRYWTVKVSILPERPKPETILQGDLPTLYDLVLKTQSSGFERINYHAVQFVRGFDEGCNFIHLTDLHLARRNDEILNEIMSGMTDRSPDAIRAAYVNFNDNLRKFVNKANEMRDNGELDFVVITGDIVDFAFCGWEIGANYAENNWKTFLEIIIGETSEHQAKDNPGIRVAVFTSTGNHDWRILPYNPSQISRPITYGLLREEIENYSYRPYDMLRYGDERRRLEHEMVEDLSDKYNFRAFGGFSFVSSVVVLLVHTFINWMVNFLKPPAILGIVALFMGPGLATAMAAPGSAYWMVASFIGGLIPFTVRWLADWLVHKTMRFVLDFPLYANSVALQCYLKHINPFFDYAFRWDKHSFVVMDSGPDIFTGAFLDDKDIHNIKRLSIEDNILGGSPDSRGFDSSHLFYNWSQIVWLDELLRVINPIDQEVNGRVFVFVHAPPINVKNSIRGQMKRYSETERKGRATTGWIPIEEYNLTYGTLNHYVSQLFYLCLGYRESEVYHPDPKQVYRKVDAVFSGHAHRNIEFRIGWETLKSTAMPVQHFKWRAIAHKLLGRLVSPPRKKKKRLIAVRIFCDDYTQILKNPPNGQPPADWWEENKPFFIQTAACGLLGDDDDKPPYFRKIRIEPNAAVSGCQPEHL